MSHREFTRSALPPAAVAVAAAPAAATLLLPDMDGRIKYTVQNCDVRRCYIGKTLGVTAATGLILRADTGAAVGNGGVRTERGWTGPVYAIAEVGGTTVRIEEVGQ